MYEWAIYHGGKDDRDWQLAIMYNMLAPAID